MRLRARNCRLITVSLSRVCAWYFLEEKPVVSHLAWVALGLQFESLIPGAPNWHGWCQRRRGAAEMCMCWQAVGGCMVRCEAHYVRLRRQNQGRLPGNQVSIAGLAGWHIWSYLTP